MFARCALSCVFVLTAALASDDNPSDDISQFWADDYKVFDQIYGKTSDKELYGTSLPASVTYGLDFKKPKTIEDSKKLERYLTNGKNILEFHPQAYDISDRYAKLFAKSLYSKSKPSSALQFISFSDFKPISESTDPETYNYLKHLENSSKEKYVYPKKLKGNYKSHADFDSESEADEAYRSIQDILDAHEANKGTAPSTEDDHEDTGARSKGQKHTDIDSDGVRYSRNRKRNKVRFLNGNSLKSRCVTGRCRSPSVRVSSRPYIRKIKHYRFSRR